MNPCGFQIVQIRRLVKFLNLSGHREDLEWPINPKYDGVSSNIMMLFGQKPLAGIPTGKEPDKGSNWKETREGRQ